MKSNRLPTQITRRPSPPTSWAGLCGERRSRRVRIGMCSQIQFNSARSELIAVYIICSPAVFRIAEKKYAATTDRADRTQDCKHCRLSALRQNKYWLQNMEPFRLNPNNYDKNTITNCREYDRGSPKRRAINSFPTYVLTQMSC